MRKTAQFVRTRLASTLSSQTTSSAFLAGLFAFYLLMGVTFSIVFPLGEAPDEPDHFSYVRYLARSRTLPVMQPRAEDNETVEAFQAPAYYVLAALLTYPVMNGEINLGRNPAFSFASPGPRVPTFFPLPEHRFPWRGAYLAWHITRFFSLALGTISLWVTYWSGRLIFHNRWLAVAAVAYLALNPQFIYLHSSATNDALATVAGGFLSLATILLLRAPSLKSFGISALAIALAALGKPSALALCPGLAFALGKAWFDLTSRRERWLALGLLIFIPIGCSGWWFVRNVRLYGDLMGMSVARQSQSATLYPEPLSLQQLVGLLPSMFWQTFRSSWGVFGWVSFPLPNWVFHVILAAHLIALLGLLARPRLVLSRRSVAIALAGSWFGLVIAFIRFNTAINTSGWQGRLLFPGLSIIALISVAGWRRWFVRREALLTCLMSAWGCFLALYALGRVVLPMYLPPSFLPPDTPVPNPLNLDFEGGLQLVGYGLRREKVDPGSDIQVTLYWKLNQRVSKNYRFFLSASTLDGRPVARRSESLLPLRYPATVWPENRIVLDRHRLSVSQDTRQVVSSLRAQVFDGHQDAQLVPHVDQAGNPLADGVVLGQVAIGPGTQPRQSTKDIQARFGGEEIYLLDYGLAPTAARAGETLTVTLHWKAIRQPQASYHVFIHLLDQGGQLVAQHDGPPRTGLYPTFSWSPGEVVEDVHRVPIPQEFEGQVQLLVGLYEFESMTRLQVTGPRGETYPNQALPLATTLVKR